MKVERVLKNALKKGPLTIGNWPTCGLKRSSKEAKARPKKLPRTLDATLHECEVYEATANGPLGIGLNAA